MSNCKQCNTGFEITDADREVFKKFAVPDPTHCPKCRLQRRLAFRNERNLFKRDCDSCKKAFVSLYAPSKPYTVYCSDCWWSDNWSPLDYGQDFDFSRPFFEQFDEVQKKVPLLGNMVFNSTNCEYNSFAVNSKDCYLSVRIEGEDIFYSYLAVNGKNCMDCFNNFQSELCYECVDCWNCYNCKYSQLSKSCSDCSFCFDCTGCKNCFGCVGLRNKEYYFLNEKCTKEEYEKKVAEVRLGDYQALQAFKKRYRELIDASPHRATVVFQSENVVGDYISESKNIFEGYDIEKTDTARYTWGAEYSKDIYDGSFIYYGENCYENISNSNSTNIKFTFAAISGVHDVEYSIMPFNGTHDCFGSVSLKHQKYCILNKQYTKEEYEEIVPKIIEYMKKTGEYGEFFPISISAFDYNESLAQMYFPLSKEEVLKQGWKWSDYEPELKADKTIRASQLPDDIKDIPDDILNWAIVCESSGKPYKIVPRELEFYRKNDLCIPRRHPDQRNLDRYKLRNPRQLWDRECYKCNNSIKTSYSPDRPEIVYCEPCYLKEVY